MQTTCQVVIVVWLVFRLGFRIAMDGLNVKTTGRDKSIQISASVVTIIIDFAVLYGAGAFSNLIPEL